MKITIDNKYMYVYADNVKIERHIAYFEEFESKNEKRKVIKITIENEEGEKFLTKNHLKIINASVSWFGGRISKCKVMFIREEKESYCHYLILLK